MKKVFFLVLIMAGLYFSANAQVNMCSITGGVEATNIKSGSNCDEIVVTLENTNSYKVTVDMSVTVVDNDGNEVVREKTVVLPANKKDKQVTFRTKKVKGETKCADSRQCTVSSLIVQKCD